MNLKLESKMSLEEYSTKSIYPIPVSNQSLSQRSRFGLRQGAKDECDRDYDTDVRQLTSLFYLTPLWSAPYGRSNPASLLTVSRRKRSSFATKYQAED